MPTGEVCGSGGRICDDSTAYCRSGENSCTAYASLGDPCDQYSECGKGNYCPYNSTH